VKLEPRTSRAVYVVKSFNTDAGIIFLEAFFRKINSPVSHDLISTPTNELEKSGLSKIPSKSPCSSFTGLIVTNDFDADFIESAGKENTKPGFKARIRKTNIFKKYFFTFKLHFLSEQLGIEDVAYTNL
jgi:hypothetical protein